MKIILTVITFFAIQSNAYELKAKTAENQVNTPHISKVHTKSAAIKHEVVFQNEDYLIVHFTDMSTTEYFYYLYAKMHDGSTRLIDQLKFMDAMENEEFRETLAGY